MSNRKLIRIPSFNLGRQSPKNDITALENKHVTLPETLFTYDLNILDLEGWFLPILIMHIFKTFLVRFDYQKVSPLALREFIIDVCDSYLEVPYHNLHHATNILHITYILLEKCELFENLNVDILFATLIAALTHDIGHPGNNNTFEINTFSELATKYNDLSILEQHHCSTTFELIKKNSLNAIYTNEEFCIFRKTILRCILGTDMTHHKSMTEYLQKKKLNGFDLSNIDEQIKLCEILVHSADIGNPIQSSEICEEWAELVNQEFSNQSIKETELGLKPSFQDTNCKLSFYSNEMKYIIHICKPYWSELVEIFPQLSNEFEMIDKNLDYYNRKYEECLSVDEKNQLSRYSL